MALVLLGASCAQAATLQQIGSFDQPVYVTSDPGNPERLFVVERAGQIELVQGAAVSTFADLRSVVSCCEGERGLLSIALAPDFDTTGRLFVDYTGTEEPGEIHVAELHASGATAPLSSLRNLLTIPHPVDGNHNGGQLQFGPTATSTSRPGTAAAATTTTTTPRTSPACSARSSASILAQRRPALHRPGRQPVPRRDRRRPTRSGATACATRSASPSTASAAASRSATSARTSGRRSTSPRPAPAPAPTTAGTAARAWSPGPATTPAAREPN